MGVAGFHSHFREDRPRKQLAEDHPERRMHTQMYRYIANVRILTCWNCNCPSALPLGSGLLLGHFALRIQPQESTTCCILYFPLPFVSQLINWLKKFGLSKHTSRDSIQRSGPSIETNLIINVSIS